MYRYADRPSSGGTIKIDHRRSISNIGSRFRPSTIDRGRKKEKKREKIPRTRCSSPVHSRGPSPIDEESSARSIARGRFLLPVRGEGTRRSRMVGHKVCVIGLDQYTDWLAARYVPLLTSIPYVDTVGSSIR
ncbi:hypothetical protein GW17_00014476 [Ensete ventricosum]|nr:hypothetical protein GW17_00014476 [Ensete ventricosum]